MEAKERFAMNVMEELKAFALCAPPSAGLSAQARHHLGLVAHQNFQQAGLVALRTGD